MTQVPLLQENKTRRWFILSQLTELFDGTENAKRWLNAPHPALGNATPQSYLDAGKLDAIENIIHVIESGQPD